jgi:hypothetical protein
MTQADTLTQSPSPPAGVGTVLREWRGRRRMRASSTLRSTPKYQPGT